ncbi:MAG: hypothetical protein N2447_09280, partial [Thermoanaerobaculum sp.]|nr:hypothetical protein [Thermoanaerobaculum sp.]
LAFLGQRVRVSESFVFGLLGGLTALWLVVPLPRTPMEWDEVLFARALVKLDVVQHSPHPPGYPVYVAAGKLLKALGIPPVHASQLVSVAGLILALTSLSAWLRSLGIPPWPRLWTWLAVLFTPCVIFAANVGLSDMFAGGLAVFAWHLLWQVHQHPTPGRAVAAGIVTALALGARPQELLLLLVPGTWFVVRGMVRRQWAWVWFLAAGLVATVSVWLPLMWLTGWERYWQAFWKLHRWMQEFEGHTRWPHMPWLWFPQDWLLRPVGGPMLGAFFWLGVIVATAALWRSGRRWVLGAWAAGGSYLFLAPFFMTAEAAVRYALPGFLLLASLWGGLVLRWPRLGWLPVAGWVLAACFWVLPALTLRAAEPSPVWAALEMARDRVPTAPVWVASGLTPHAEVIFAWDQRRFQPVALERGLPPRGFLVVCDRWVRGRVWFSLVWPKEPMASLTRRRYLSARVVELGVR